MTTEKPPSGQTTADTSDEGELPPTTVEAAPSSGVQPMKPVLKSVIGYLERVWDHRPRPGGIPSRLWLMDEQLGGLQPGELVVIAARPHADATSLALTWIANLVVDVSLPVPMLIFSLDHSSGELCRRLVCSMAKVDGHNLLHGYASTPDFVELTHAASLISDARLYVDDTIDATLEELCAAARSWWSAQKGQTLIVIDAVRHLEDPRTSTSGGARYWRRVGAELKRLALELGATVVAVAGLSPSLSVSPDEVPTLSDLEPRELERAADVVVFVHRAELPHITHHHGAVEVAELVVAKHPLGVVEVPLAFYCDLGRFENLAQARLPDESSHRRRRR